MTPSSRTSFGSGRGVDEASARGPDLGLEPGGGKVRRSDKGNVEAALEGRLRLSPTGRLSARFQVLSLKESSVPSSLRRRAVSIVRVSAGASGDASFILKRIADVGSNKAACIYSRSLAAETGPIKPPAALKYCNKTVKQAQTHRECMRSHSSLRNTDPHLLGSTPRIFAPACGDRCASFQNRSWVEEAGRARTCQNHGKSPALKRGRVFRVLGPNQ